MACQKKYRLQAAGGTLVKRDGRRIRREQGTSKLVASPKPDTDRPAETVPGDECSLPTDFFMENWGLNDWNTRGWHGGGQIPIRNLKQRRRPMKGRHFLTRKAHPNLLKLHG